MAFKMQLGAVGKLFLFKKFSGTSHRIFLNIKRDHFAGWPNQFAQHCSIVSAAGGRVDAEVAFFYMFTDHF